MITKKKEKRGVSPFVAAITGAVIGAGVAVASVITFKDKKNRDKVKKVLNNVKDQAEKYVKKSGKKIIVKKTLTKKL